ncbi:MAG TPA: hypothetical protein VJ576_12790 [Rhodocyclaceae bacterium]|nr:hypothetical protein [Rhodocyclaceae bacterium]
MKTTALFAFIVALFARQPAPSASGSEEQGVNRPVSQQLSPELILKASPEVTLAKISGPKSAARRNDALCKD